MTDRPSLPAGDDPSVRAVLDAIAFTTAAIDGHTTSALQIARASRDDEPPWFLDALISTVQLLADEARDGGIDVHRLLRDVGLGVQLAHLAESDNHPDP